MSKKIFRTVIAIIWLIVCIISIVRTNWLFAGVSAIVMCAFLYKAFNTKE